MKLQDMKAAELKQMAKDAKVKNWWNMKKAELIAALTDYEMNDEPVDEYELNDEIEINLDDVEPKPYEHKPFELNGSFYITCDEPKTENNVIDDDETYITLQSICEDIGIKPKKARRILRKSEIEKPGKSWKWLVNDPDLEKTIKLLKGEDE